MQLIYRLPEELDVVESLFGIIVFGCLVLFPFYLLESIFYKTVPMNLTSLWVISVLSLLVCIFVMLFWNYGNRVVGPARAAVFVNLIPVFGIILAINFLGERFLQSHAIGAICIISGVILVIKNHLAND